MALKEDKTVASWGKENRVAPVVIWLNGGPGVTSMLGLFYENGPLSIKWAGSEVITQDIYGEDLYQFVEQFYQLFPDSYNNELYIGGQSYGAKYVTAFAYRLHQAIRRGESIIPLTGIYLGGPFFAPGIVAQTVFDYMYNLGVVSKSQVIAQRARVAALLKEYSAGLILKNVTKRKISRTIFPVDIPFSSNYVTKEHIPYGAVHEIMASWRIRQAVHAGYLTYANEKGNTGQNVAYDYLSSALEKLGALLDVGSYKVLVFGGDYDAITTPSAVEESVLAIPWVGQAEYANATRQRWSWFSSNKTHQGGWFSLARHLCRVTVIGAGHHVPHDQLDASREMMKQFVAYGCVKEMTQGK
ncbi:carboxypeptidase [Elysia marginata]|uniref:Carboxypeptidase n=1 Tax=Elysia marginata TaxID=1093978 RepID=A0AAV4GTN6_9GAST|nr:carboxypeptidase [Elysia marginata]